MLALWADTEQSDAFVGANELSNGETLEAEQITHIWESW